MDGIASGMIDGPRRALITSALGAGQVIAWGTSYYLAAVLAKPIQEDTGWALSWVVGGVSLGLLVAGLISRRIGRAIGRHGGRPVLAGSAVMLAAGLLVLAATTNLPVYVIGWLILGLGMGAGLYDAAFSALGRLFGSSARGAITTLTLWGGFASTVCWPLSAYLVESVGWRGTCLVYAGLHIGVVLPLYWFGLPREATSAGEAPPARDEGGPAPEPMTPRRRQILIALLATILTAGGTIAALWSIHLITLLQADGLTLAAAVGLGALVGPSQVGARVVEMLGRGRHHPIWTLAAAALLIAAGLGLLLVGIAVPAVALIAYGAGNGIWTVGRGTLPLTVFGPIGYAELMGRLAMPSLIAQAAAPSAGALLIEHAGAAGLLAVMFALALANVAGVAVLRLLTRRQIAG